MILAALLLTLPAAGVSELPAVLIGEPRVDENTSQDLAAGVARIVEAEARDRLNAWRVVSIASVRATLDAAVELSCLGSDELTIACTSEIGDALGASNVLTVELGRVGSLRLLTLALIDTTSASVQSQVVQRIAIDDDGGLLDAAAAATREVLAPLGVETSAPPPLLSAGGDPLPFVVAGIGGAVILGAALVQIGAVASLHTPWATGTATREDAKFWEDTWPAWHGGAVLGYAAGAAILVGGVAMTQAGNEGAP